MSIFKKTHLEINEDLCGKPLELKEGYSKLELITNKNMIVDEKNLIHGGFTFSLGDYTAMLAVNHPNVVLTGANVKFIKPIVLGDQLISEGMVTKKTNSRIIVDVKIKNKNNIAFSGEFFCYIPDKHILEVSKR